MPNWCHNTLAVEGPSEEVAAFVNKARQASEDEEQPLFFANFVPEPDYTGSQDWWDWRVENWGTKWEPSFSGPMIAFGAEGADPGAEKEELALFDLGDDRSKAAYEFDTAWAPPIPVIEAASAQHPNLTLTLVWGEPGNDFGGRIIWRGGAVSEEEEGRAEEYLPTEKMWF